MVELLTSKQLAAKAGVDPRKLRKLIREEFKGAGKADVEGNRKEYRFDLDDPLTQRIIDRAKAGKVKAKEAAKAEEPKAEKAVKAEKPKAEKIPAGKRSKAPKGKNSPVRIIRPTETPQQVADRLAPVSSGGVPIDLSKLPGPTDQELKAIEAEGS